MKIENLVGARRCRYQNFLVAFVSAIILLFSVSGCRRMTYSFGQGTAKNSADSVVIDDTGAQRAASNADAGMRNPDKGSGADVTEDATTSVENVPPTENAEIKMAWYMDRSGSMSGFSGDGQLRDYIDYMLDSARDSFKTKVLKDSSEFISIRTALSKARDFSEWYKDRSFGGRTNLAEAFKDISTRMLPGAADSLDVAVVISDGLPSAEARKLPPCTTQFSRESINFDFDNFVDNNISIWAGVTEMDFNGTRFLECNQNKNEVAQKLNAEMARRLDCPAHGECLIRGVHETSAVVVFVICSPEHHDRCSDFVKLAAKNTTETPTTAFVQAWPPEIPPIDVSARRGWYNPATTMKEELTCGFDKDNHRHRTCDMLCYNKQLLMFFDVNLKPSAPAPAGDESINIIGGYDIAYSLVPLELASAKLSLPMVSGRDYLETKVWMAGKKAPPGAYLPGAGCSGLLKTILENQDNEGTQQTADEPSGRRWEYRIATACECLYEMNLAAGGKPENPAEFVAGVALKREYTPRSLDNTAIGRWSTSDVLKKPTGIFGLSDLLQNILDKGAIKANELWGTIGTADINISLPRRAPAKGGCGAFFH